MFIYDYSCLGLVSVPCTIHLLDRYLALEFCAAYSYGLNNTRRHLCVSGGCVRQLRSVYMCFAGALRPLYTLPRSEEACFVLNLPAILNLIYRRMLTTISDEHSIARTLCNALIIFSTYSFNSMMPFRTQS